MNATSSYLCLLLISLGLIISCSTTEDEAGQSCNNDATLISSFENPEGQRFQIFDNGYVYRVVGGCQSEGQYFDPEIFDFSFKETNDGTYLIVDDSTLYKPHSTFLEDFEHAKNLSDLFIESSLDRSNIFTGITLQSPATPAVEAYNALRLCILNETCEFIDNRIDLAIDPVNSNNSVLKFHAVSPAPDMVTSKSSIFSTVLHQKKGDDFWYEAKYYIEDNYPSTIADFESGYFLGSPGPRLIFRGDKLAVENKFADKINYDQTVNPKVKFPIKEWVTIKVHLQYDEKAGIIQVWQNGEPIIDAVGNNIPLDFWIQSNLEVGISATQNESTIYIDDLRFSDSPF